MPGDQFWDGAVPAIVEFISRKPKNFSKKYAVLME
jgi:hypothetical protein